MHTKGCMRFCAAVFEFMNRTIFFFTNVVSTPQFSSTTNKTFLPSAWELQQPLQDNGDDRTTFTVTWLFSLSPLGWENCSPASFHKYHWPNRRLLWCFPQTGRGTSLRSTNRSTRSTAAAVSIFPSVPLSNGSRHSQNNREATGHSTD